MVEYSERIGRLHGNVIRTIFKMVKDPNVISLGGGNPAAECFPIDTIKDIADEMLMKHGSELLQYGPTTGYGPLREAYLQNLVYPKGVKADMDNTLVVTGSQQGIFIALDVFLDKGDVVLVEDPTFLATLNIMRKYGVNFVGVEMGPDGMVMEDLEKKVKELHPKMLYTIPNYQNPSGCTLPEASR